MKPYGMDTPVEVTTDPFTGVSTIGVVVRVSAPNFQELIYLAYEKCLLSLAAFQPPPGMEVTKRGEIKMHYSDSQHDDPLAYPDMKVWAKQVVTIEKIKPKPQPYMKGVYQP